MWRRILAIIAVGFFSILWLSAPAAAQEVRRVTVTEFGAVADGRTDSAQAIQAAIDAVSDTGGEVVLPASPRAYLVRTGLRIGADGVRLTGPGATIALADGALGGKVIDLIEIRGTPEDPVEGVVVRGLTLDANYWAQPGSYNPRGIDIDHATGVLIDSVRIDRAFVGLCFGLGTRDSEARDCVVTRWYCDAYAVSGDGYSGGSSGIRFVRCVAEDSPDEGHGGLPGNRNNAWEIEDGAYGVEVIDSAVRNAGGNGFAVRNHPTGHPVTTGGVRFVRCRAERVSRLGFHVRGNPSNTIDGVEVVDCITDSVSVFEKDVRGLVISGSRFDGTVTLGPARSAVIRNSSFTRVRVWSLPVGGVFDGYRSSFVFRGCSFENPVSVFGDGGFVVVEE